MMRRKLITFLFLCLLLPALGHALSRENQFFDADGDRLFENLKAKMDEVSPATEIPVLILYKEEVSAAGISAVRLKDVPARNIKYVYQLIPAVAAKLTPSQIRKVLEDPRVEHVEPDARVTVGMATAAESFGVENAREQFHFTGDRDGNGNVYTSSDIVIAIVDTGIDANHPDLNGKVLHFRDYISNQTAPYDDHGHGTHVAGVAAGAGKVNPDLAGVAPGSALVVFKVLDAGGAGSVSDVIRAIQEIVALKAQYNIRIINLSLEVKGSSDGRDSFSIACNQAVKAGLVMIVAAGNSGPTAGTIGEGAAGTLVITVGAGADTGEKGFYLADFSSRGPTADGRVKPDLWAPGIALRSPKRNTGYSGASGTSFSAPFVAGVVALMFDANPDLTPADIKKILLATSQKWAPGKKSNEFGSGRLQAYDAITRAASIAENLNPPAVPALKFYRKSILNGETQFYTFRVSSKNFPIAVTAIILNYPAAGLQLQIISPAGIVRNSSFVSRQIGLHFKPAEIGNYQLKVRGVRSSTEYLLDFSADLAP